MVEGCSVGAGALWISSQKLSMYNGEARCFIESRYYGRLT